MNQLVPILADRAPVLIAAAGERAQTRFWEFFVSNIRNPHTRRAYWPLDRGIPRLVRAARDGLKQLERPHLPRCVAANSLSFFII